MNFGEKYIYHLSGGIENYFELSSDRLVSRELLDIIKVCMFFTIKHKDFSAKSKVKLSVFMHNSNQVTINFDEDHLASQSNFVFINHNILEEKNNIEQHLIFVEEFVHHFWDSHDERYVKSVVCDIFTSNNNSIGYDYKDGCYMYKNIPLSVG